MISPLISDTLPEEIFDAVTRILPPDMNNRIETITKALLLHSKSINYNLLTLKKITGMNFIEAEFSIRAPRAIVRTCNYAFFENSPISPHALPLYSFSKSSSPDILRAKIAELIAPRIPLEDLRYEVTTYLTTCIIHLQGILDIDDALLFTQTPTELGRAFVIYFPKDYEMDIRSLIRSLPLPPSEYAMFHPFSEIHDSDRELDHESLYLQLTFPLPR